MPKIYFSEPNSSGSLWITDGTVAGTRQLGGSPREIEQIVAYAGGVLFSIAPSDGFGGQLWDSNGTSAGTAEIRSFAIDSEPTDITVFGGKAYFGAAAGQPNYSLWRSDGTSAGTVALERLIGNFGTSSVSDFVSYGGSLYFIVNYQAPNFGVTNTLLWKTNGTAAGTSEVAEIYSGLFPSVESLTVYKGELYFAGYDSKHGVELWQSNGTPAGTKIAADIRTSTTVHTNSGNGDSDPESLTVSDGYLFFSADNGVAGRELWETDGSADYYFDLNTGFAASNPQNLTDVNGTLYFTANNGADGVELWSVVKGVNAAIVADIDPGAASSAPSNLTNINGVLYFTANDGVHGVQLWRTNGTKGGTVRVAGGNISQPTNLTNVDGVLYFEAFDGSSEGLFRTNGTSTGTVEIATHVDVKSGIAFVPTTVRSSVSYTLPANADNLILTGSGNINGAGNGLNNVLTGNSGANVLSGLGGDDTLNGGTGNDTLDGGVGADRMAGGAGNDIYVVENAHDVVIESVGAGVDTVKSSISYRLPANVENLILAGAGAVNGAGNALANAITGNAANNVLSGGGGNDTLNGAAGADTLIGGGGRDKATGGAGDDSFWFTSPGTLSSPNVMEITDFAHGADRLVFEDAGFNLGVDEGRGTAVVQLMNPALFSTHTDGTFATAGNRFAYNSSTGSLFYDADGSGNKSSAELIAKLDHQPTLTASDLFFKL
jgi:ELWxxDGT repeat protein